MIWTLLLVLGVMSLPVVIAAYTLITGVAPMPSRSKVSAHLLSLIPRSRHGILYELGSGWGTLAIPLARRHPHCRVVGYELSPLPWLVSKFLAWLPNLQIRRKDFFTDSLKDASVVVCYLSPGAMRRLKTKFEQELRPGTLVISNTFAIPSWSPDRTLIIRGIIPTPVYVYTVR